MTTSNQPRPGTAGCRKPLIFGPRVWRFLFLCCLSPLCRSAVLREGRAEFSLQTSFAFCKNNKTKNTTRSRFASVQLPRAAAGERESRLLGSSVAGQDVGPTV